ncbi:S8 family peptidase [Clostridium vincentii]|uniref:Subtilase family protein n=1 Tax=Clostridium vincentii TaxID=52704 RepID=A0A2T0BH55_9CLOT|nr:S8 family peptidase [Clostridium vincentii]PRR83178.1 Subtilase family protein [Clostridium vincentii]
MASFKDCSLYFEDSPNFLVEYRGNLKEEIDKISYACGDIITSTIGVISTPYQYLNQLVRNVPSIIYINPRGMYVLQDISPSNVDYINNTKINPYLNLTGSGVLIGMVDTGIDYLNEEFKREDGTSRIMNIWDQTIQVGKDKSVYIGDTYSNEEINNAINAYKNGGNPYEIVPSKDDIGHGTKIAGVIGARGYNGQFQGVAHDSDYVVVKLFESINFRNRLKANGIEYNPVYNDSEVLAGIEYLKNYSIKAKRPMVIYIGVGTTEGSHDGKSVMSKYLTSISGGRGIVIVAGVGNEGAAEGHASGYIENLGDIATVELKIPREIKYFSFNIWVQKPNRATLNVISPTGEESKFIKIVRNRLARTEFVFLNTTMEVSYFSPEHFTGHEVISINFNDIKPGIWKFQLRGDYVTNGRYDIWLQPKITLPEETKFLESDPFITLTIPSTARKVATVAYCGNENAILASSGKGSKAADTLDNPDFTILGINILTTQVGGGVTTVSGSSAATGIATGVCALLLQWGIVNGNDKTMNSIRVIIYLIHGADRSNPSYRFPNKGIGYGFLDLLGTFNVINRSYRENRNIDKNYTEYYCNNLFVRIPRDNMEDCK